MNALRALSALVLGALLLLTGCDRGRGIPPPPRADGLSVHPSFLAAAADTDAARKAFHAKKVHVPLPGSVAFPVDFKDLPQRVTWDLALSVDLKAKRGLQFDFCCTDLTQFRSFSFYFKSGDGWYHGTFSPEEEGVWSHMTVLKSDCHTEGHPAGWEKVDAIRISGWRAGTGRATCAFANLATLGGDPEVLVVYAESMTAKEASVARDSLMFGGRLVSTLTALGLESTLVADTDLTTDLLKGERTLVLPYNPEFPAEKLQIVKDHVRRGGRFLGCYRLPTELESVLGIRTLGAVRPTDKGGAAITGFLRVGPGLPGQPEYAPQASWMTQVVAKDPGVRVVAEWASAPTVSSRRPALVRTSKGLFMSHVWLGGSSGAPLALMRSVIADLAPHLDVKMAARQQQLAEEQAARTAWLKGRKSKKGEYRAFWCHDARGLGGGRDWEASIRFLKDNGFNSILPNLAWAGAAFYQSSVLPVEASVKTRGDALQQCLAACRKYGVQCHVWKVCWNMGQYATKDFEEKMVKANRVQVNPKGEKKTRWLCPSHPENQRLEIEAMVELAKKGVDGVHFDYIRYPDGSHCFCNGCRKRFEAFLGHAVPSWPSLDGPVVPNGPELDLRTAWKDFRTANITAVVKAVAERVHKECPGVKVSAATFRNAKSDPYEVGQDWSAWCRNGWLDFVCNMDYEDSYAMFRSQVTMQKDVIGKAKLYPGIGLSCFMSDGNESVRLAKQIEIVRQLGLEGFTVFNFDRTAERVLPELRTGPTKD